MTNFTIGRILLILLLFCSHGQGVCFDRAGNSYVCVPELFSSEDRKGDPCQCPCEDGECEEHSLKVAQAPVERTSIPTAPCSDLSFDESASFELSIRGFSEDSSDMKLGPVDGSETSLRLRRVMLAGVCMRI